MPVGTTQYLPPEMLQFKDYRAFKCDLFSAGVCLFMMVTGSYPYRFAASSKCNLFKALQDPQPKAFWSYHTKAQDLPRGYYSTQFRDLIKRMLKEEPNQRLNLEQVRNHPWMKGQMPTREELAEEFRDRKKKVIAQLIEEKLLKKQKKGASNEKKNSKFLIPEGFEEAVQSPT